MSEKIKITVSFSDYKKAKEFRDAGKPSYSHCILAIAIQKSGKKFQAVRVGYEPCGRKYVWSPDSIRYFSLPKPAHDLGEAFDLGKKNINSMFPVEFTIEC